MAPRGGAVPRRGDRVRRVSFLIDLGAGSRSDRAEVKLVVRRLLSHLAHQRPAPPRWCVRLYDSRLSPHAFESRLTARAEEARRASKPAPAPHDGVSSRVRSWVDETVRDAAGAPRAGSRDALRAVPFASGRTFHACEPDAVAAFEAHYDEVATLYHRHDGDLIDGLPPSPGPGTAHAATAAAASDDLASWFTTLARQMAATAQAARELPTGEGIGGAPTLDRLDDRSAARALDAHALGGHDLVLVLAVAPPPPRADPAAARRPRTLRRGDRAFVGVSLGRTLARRSNARVRFLGPRVALPRRRDGAEEGRRRRAPPRPRRGEEGRERDHPRAPRRLIPPLRRMRVSRLPRPSERDAAPPRGARPTRRRGTPARAGEGPALSGPARYARGGVRGRVSGRRRRRESVGGSDATRGVRRGSSFRRRRRGV